MKKPFKRGLHTIEESRSTMIEQTLYETEENLYNQYRKLKDLTNQNIRSRNVSCFCFSQQNLTNCTCDKVDNRCVLSSRWFNMLYDDKQRDSLKQIYSRYKKNKRIDINSYQFQIEEDIESIKKYWSHQENQSKIFELINVFGKYCTYYRKIPYRKIYAWLAFTILDHSQPSEGFWILQAIIDKMEFAYPNFSLTPHIEIIYQYLCRKCDVSMNLQKQNIDMKSIIKYLLDDMMCSFTPVQYYAFNIDWLLKQGWNHLYKIVISYICSGFNKITKYKIQQPNQILTCILNDNTPWPLIFYNSNSIKL